MPISPENRKRYPKNWADISRRIRFERAQGQCEFVINGERCKARNGEPHPDTGSKVVLTVAHLDHQPENCADENLRAGCQRCHLRYDAHHHRSCKSTADLFKKGEDHRTPEQYRKQLKDFLTNKILEDMSINGETKQ